MQHSTHSQMSAGMESCIQACTSCHRVCLETIQHCLGMGGKHAEASHIRLMMDCVQICHTSADYMIRGSDLHALTCGACAEVCQRCAEDCERVDPNDAQMQKCAQECRRCADECRRMAAQAA